VGWDSTNVHRVAHPNDPPFDRNDQAASFYAPLFLFASVISLQFS
jgi:hypothetical protein